MVFEKDSGYVFGHKEPGLFSLYDPDKIKKEYPSLIIEASFRTSNGPALTRWSSDDTIAVRDFSDGYFRNISFVQKGGWVVLLEVLPGMCIFFIGPYNVETGLLKAKIHAPSSGKKGNDAVFHGVER